MAKSRKNVKPTRNATVTAKPKPGGRKSVPAAINMPSKARVPTFHAETDGTILVRHTEYVENVAGSLTFDAGTGRLINPGIGPADTADDGGCFTWLAALAKAYESYRIKRFRLLYKPLVGTTTTGRVYIGFDPNPGHAAPTTAADAYAKQWHAGASVWSPTYVDIVGGTGKPMPEFRLVRNSTTTSVPADTRPLYDFGRVIASGVGNASTAAIGELWVEYTIELRGTKGI
jgi:hypothetical protein